MRLVLTLLVVALVLPAAGLASNPPVGDEARLAAYLPIAIAAWPDSPCPQPHVLVGAEADADIANWDAIDGQHTMGRAHPERCSASIQSGLPAVTFCDVLVHELGHDAGYDHTDDPLGVHAPAGIQAAIMLTRFQEDWPACVLAATGSVRYQVIEMIHTALPWRGYGWRIVCTPFRGRGARCRATLPPARPRRYAVILIGGKPISIEELDSPAPKPDYAVKRR